MDDPFDGTRVRDYLNAEAESLLRRYRQFATLLPSETSAGAAHRGEDGRFVESLIRSYLAHLLPTSLEVASGFILRPAVKTGSNGRERSGESDRHSQQLDIIVFDSANYPVFQRFAGNAVVPPEGVIAIISVKKTLRAQDVTPECEALRTAARLCHCLDAFRNQVRGPFLALVGMTAGEKKPSPTSIFSGIRQAYLVGEKPTFDEVVGYVGAIDEFSVFKSRPTSKMISAAQFVLNPHHSNGHWALQFILSGILSVFYDRSRNRRRRPGFSSFPLERPGKHELGSIEVSGLR